MAGCEKTCDLHALLFDFYPAVRASYRAGAGLRRDIELAGSVHTFSSRNERFQGKGVTLRISSPVDDELAAKLGALASQEDVNEVCGEVRIRADLERDTFHPNHPGEGVLEFEPVEATLVVEPDSFDRIHSQVADAYGRRRILTVSLELVGRSLPEPSRGSLLGVELGELDVSETRRYAVGRFDLAEFKDEDRFRGRVFAVERDSHAPPGARIRARLTEASFEVDMELGLIRSISCEGTVLGMGQAFDQADVSITLVEFEPDRLTQRLPKRALAGEFGYYPRGSDARAHLSVVLRYVASDAEAILLPVVNFIKETGLVISLELDTPEETLIHAPDPVHGNVHRYAFRVHRSVHDQNRQQKS